MSGRGSLAKGRDLWRRGLAPYLPTDGDGREIARLIGSWTREDLVLARDHLVRNAVAGSLLTPRMLRWVLYRAVGFDIQTPNIREHCVFRSSGLSIGVGSAVGSGCLFVGVGAVSIGRSTFIGPRTMIFTSHHGNDPDGSVTHAPEPRPVHIGDDVWIGGGTVLVPGAVVEDNCIVGAGSVVAGRCEADGVYAGAPARRVAERPPRTEVATSYEAGVARSA
jgi:maltose O-acetyltransferase